MTTLPTTLTFAATLEPGTGISKSSAGSDAARKGASTKAEMGLTPFDRLLKQAGQTRAGLPSRPDMNPEDTDTLSKGEEVPSAPTTKDGGVRVDNGVQDIAVDLSTVINAEPFATNVSPLPDPVSVTVLVLAAQLDTLGEKASHLTTTRDDDHPSDDSPVNVATVAPAPSARADHDLKAPMSKASASATGEAALNYSPAAASTAVTDESEGMAPQEGTAAGSTEATGPTPADPRYSPTAPPSSSTVPQSALSLAQANINGLPAPSNRPSDTPPSGTGSRASVARASAADQRRPETARSNAREPGRLREEAPDRLVSAPAGTPGSDMRLETTTGAPTGAPGAAFPASSPSSLTAGSATNTAPPSSDSNASSPMSGVTIAGSLETPFRSNGASTSQAPVGYTSDRIDEPIHDPAFPRVLGLKIGQWTQDGVQQVWLDVHPADMGPVAISIALNGQQAELNFGAESASARQAIESSLPELAAALQNAGLTLSGGSISQQLSQSQNQEEQSSSSSAGGGRPGAGRSSAVSAAQPMPERRAVGLLDLYA